MPDLNIQQMKKQDLMSHNRTDVQYCFDTIK